MSVRGIDVRQDFDRLLFRVSLKDASGNKVVTGTTDLRVYRINDSGTLDVLDWTTFDFVATGSGTPDDETTMTHRQRRDSTGADVDTGIWTTTLTTLTNFAQGQVYVAQITNTNATPESQEREFQYGSFEGSSTYYADIQFVRDQANTQDEYIAVWFRDGIRITTGITNAKIHVVKRADGTDLIALTSMTQIGTTGSYKYDAVTTERQTVGESVVVLVEATIDGSTRSWARALGRDST